MELKSAEDVDGIRAAGMVLERALHAGSSRCVCGATTADIDRAIRDSIEQAGGEPLFLGYRGPTARGAEGAQRAPFPASSCISVNDELVHGVPGTQRIEDGDIVSIDAGVRLNGWCADSAVTVLVGAADQRMLAMVACAERMLGHAVARIVPGRRWSSIAFELEQLAEESGFSVAVDFVGHGIGRALHECPQVPSSVTRRYLDHDDFTLRPGMVLAIEPMLVDEQPRRNAAGELVGPACTLSSDGWTVRVDSGARSCHVEHTVVVTRDGAEVLTAAGTAHRASSAAACPVREACAA